MGPFLFIFRLESPPGSPRLHPQSGRLTGGRTRARAAPTAVPPATVFTPGPRTRGRPGTFSRGRVSTSARHLASPTATPPSVTGPRRSGRRRDRRPSSFPGPPAGPGGCRCTAAGVAVPALRAWAARGPRHLALRSPSQVPWPSSSLGDSPGRGVLPPSSV